MDSFAALADPNRRRMLELLGDGPLPSGTLAASFDLSAPAVSQHLKALREAGLVRVQAEGPRRIYSLDPHGLAEVEMWIGRVRKDWKQRLDQLEAVLRAEQGEA
ncbi:ArsR/SmtB family transcription factor [Sphingosinicella terrae]|uniref:ArsR/SmtB family transcription factor n=1 Tax=Sphingosinicella terrae TaxID=2172047 RepID=UPI000E0D985C|nr:metalloregulator ArsR/SmtB family transcription factor [Sphingosinicella terrae]